MANIHPIRTLGTCRVNINQPDLSGKWQQVSLNLNWHVGSELIGDELNGASWMEKSKIDTSKLASD